MRAAGLFLLPHVFKRGADRAIDPMSNCSILLRNDNHLGSWNGGCDMPDNPLGERGRSLEDDYFRKRDQELIEKLRQATAVEEARQKLDDAREEMGKKTGLADPALLRELQELGFTPDTVSLLPL